MPLKPLHAGIWIGVPETSGTVWLAHDCFDGPGVLDELQAESSNSAAARFSFNGAAPRVVR